MAQLKSAILGADITVPALVRTAWSSASSFRGVVPSRVTRHDRISIWDMG